MNFITVAMPSWVRFRGDGGYPGERQRALEELTVGEEYVILRLDIGRSDSRVFIATAGGKPVGEYNTAMFDFLAWGVDFDSDNEDAAAA